MIRLHRVLRYYPLYAVVAAVVVIILDGGNLTLVGIAIAFAALVFAGALILRRKSRARLDNGWKFRSGQKFRATATASGAAMIPDMDENGEVK